MTRKRRIAFVALVALQAVIPLAMVGLNDSALASGDKVRLQAVPVDPHDPFRGEYVELSYRISTVSAPPGARVGGDVYVELGKSGEAWTATSTSVVYPTGDETFIRGRVVDLYDGKAQVEYGIETYYVEEGQGPKLEEAILRNELYVDVVLDADGHARIEEVVVGDA